MTTHLYRSGLVAVTVVAVVLALLSYPLEASAGTDPCPAQLQAMELLRSRIKSDQDAIKRLNIGITQRELDDAADIAESGRKAAMLAAALSLLDGFLNTPEAALETKTIAGYKLKNGLGSIGTGQANVLIGRIRAQGGVKEALIPLLRELSQISEKTSKFEYLRALSRAASALKSTADLGAGENSLEEAEALFGLAAAIAAPADLAVSLASAIVNSAKNQTQIYLMAKSIDQLTNTAESQLKALKVLSAKLQTDVQTLQRFSAADICDTDVSWQIALQQQRMDAAAAGNIDFYNQLLRLHAQIFKLLGLQPCESGFYPGGCNSTPSPKGQAAQGAAGNCPPFSPRNAQDALQVEESSHKDVCWAYNGRTLVATSSQSPDKANKPSPSNSESGGGSPSSALTIPTVPSVAPSSSPGETASDSASVDATITKTSHSRWDTLHPFLVGRGHTSVHYYPASDGKSHISVAHLVTKSQQKPHSKAVLSWCSGLLFEGVPFTYDTFMHNHNYADLRTCTEIDTSEYAEKAIDEKGRPIRAASGEMVYVAVPDLSIQERTLLSFVPPIRLFRENLQMIGGILQFII